MTVDVNKNGTNGTAGVIIHPTILLRDNIMDLLTRAERRLSGLCQECGGELTAPNVMALTILSDIICKRCWMEQWEPGSDWGRNIKRVEAEKWK